MAPLVLTKPMLGPVGWLKHKVEVLAEVLLVALAKQSQDEIANALVDVAVIVMSGETVANLKVPRKGSVADIKSEVAKVDQSRTPAGRLRLLHENQILPTGTTLNDVCKEDQQNITFNLVRLSRYSIEKTADSPGKLKYCEYFMSKFVLTGDSGTGKTNLMTRFARDEFEEEFIPTIGVDSMMQTLTVDEKTIVKCQISDNAGVERYGFRTMTPHYRGATGILVVCDVTNRASFENLSIWLDLIRRHADDDVTLCIIANKVDLEEERQVTQAELASFAASNGIECFEVSAKTDDNVNEPFYYLTETILDKRRALEEDSDDE